MTLYLFGVPQGVHSIPLKFDGGFFPTTSHHISTGKEGNVRTSQVCCHENTTKANELVYSECDSLLTVTSS